MPGLFWTDHQVTEGWRLVRADDGASWRAEQLDGPRALTDANLPGLLRQLAGDDAALQRRFTERQIRAAAAAANVDPEPLVAELRA